MATSKEFADFVSEQVTNFGSVRSRKMFGEYMVYINNKPVLLLCDNTVFVKMLPEIEGYMQNAEKGYPYDGAKEHYILDIENTELLQSVLPVLIEKQMLPAKRKKKLKEAQNV